MTTTWPKTRTGRGAARTRRFAGLAISAAVLAVPTAALGSTAARPATPSADERGSGAVVCSYQWHNYVNRTGGLEPRSDIRRGPDNRCSTRVNTGGVSAYITFHCWLRNTKGNIWWHIQWGDTMGWVYTPYAPPTLISDRCN